MKNLIILLIISVTLIWSCTQEPLQPNCGSMYLKDNSAFPIAISVGVDKQNEPLITEILRTETSRITSKEFYTSLLWESETGYHFTRADANIDFALQHQKKVHAHCLLYPIYSVSPEFLVNYPGNNAEFEELVRQFITTTLTRYRGKIQSYDITNEIFEYNGGNASKTWLRQRFSSDEEFFAFIARCYRYAHEADPDALLFYNDYGQEFTNENFIKGNAILAQLNQWKAEGVPIHGYGLQLHTNIYRPIKDIEAALRIAVTSGLKIHISELDVAINWADFDIDGVTGGEQNITATNEAYTQQQGEMFKKIALAYKKIVPKDQQYGITLWDVSDKENSFFLDRYDAGTLFDMNYQRKTSFYSFLEGLSGGPNPSCKCDCK